MANRVYFTIKEERELDKNFKPIGESSPSLYIHCDGIVSYIGAVNSYEEIIELIAPNKIIETLNEPDLLSGIELDEFLEHLEPGNQYSFYDEKFIVPEHD